MLMTAYLCQNNPTATHSTTAKQTTVAGPFSFLYPHQFILSVRDPYMVPGTALATKENTENKFLESQNAAILDKMRHEKRKKKICI